MTNYYDSGLYSEPFFIKHKHLELDYYCILEEMIGSNDFHLFAEYYGDDLDYRDDDDLREQIGDLFLEKISYWSTYFEPLIFNKKIALECDLTPFVHQGTKLLALSGCGMDLSPRLDAYQALTDTTIDKTSYLFTRPDYFEYVLGSTVVEKVKHVISYEADFNKSNESVEVVV